MQHQGNKIDKIIKLKTVANFKNIHKNYLQFGVRLDFKIWKILDWLTIAFKLNAAGAPAEIRVKHNQPSPSKQTKFSAERLAYKSINSEYDDEQ